jgi:butyrate kinase
MNKESNTVKWTEGAKNLLSIIENAQNNDEQADAIFRDMFYQVLKTFELEGIHPHDYPIYRDLTTKE